MSVNNNLIASTFYQPLKRVISDNVLFYSKITAVALAVIGAVALIFIIATRCFRKKPNNPTTVPIGTGQNPPNKFPSPQQQDPYNYTPPFTPDPYNFPFHHPKPSKPFQMGQFSPKECYPTPLVDLILKQKRNLTIPQAPFSDKVDSILKEVTEKIFYPTFPIVTVFETINEKMDILDLFNELIKEFEMRHPPHKKIKYGDQVPSYFANVDDDKSNDAKKYLSLVGIRNMLMMGPQIIDDLRKQLFLGGKHHYLPKEGLDAFSYYTGTTVDLDTVLKADNDKEAIKEAEKYIIDFGKACGLSGNLTAKAVAKQLPNRKLNLPETYQMVHDSGTSDTDRSNYGIWKRKDLKTHKYVYYVNVPKCDVVLNCTLRFPYMITELVWRAKEANGGKMSKEFLDDFFKEGLSTMCFNDKIKKFIDFYSRWKPIFDGVETSEVSALRKLLEGVFGDPFKAIGTHQLLGFPNQDSLSIFFDSVDFKWLGKKFEFKIQGIKKDSWILIHLPICYAILKEQGYGNLSEIEEKGQKKTIWVPNILYRHQPANPTDKEEDKDYFPLDEIALKSFLSYYYDVIAATEGF